MRARFGLLALTVAAGGLTHCSSENPESSRESTGEAEVALTNAPTDVSCLRLTIGAPSRTDVRKFPLTSGQKATFRLQGVPVGNASFAADAFPVSCDKPLTGVNPTWYSEPVAARVSTREAVHVALSMIHNGRASVGVDFDDKNAPDAGPAPALTGGTFSSAQPYVVPVEPGVRSLAILTAGDSPNLKPDGTPYRMVGIPDGLGAFDNGDGTFTVVMNHELGATNGIARAHGAAGAFVSKWIIRKADLAVMSIEDLIKQVVTWNPTTSSYNAPATGIAFARFCSADLPAPSALFDAASGKGFDGRLFFNGEENGDEGRAVVHGMDGTSFETPRLGKFSWENSVANPGTGEKTVVLGTDDAGGGQLYVYVGDKTTTGSPIDKAGLTNGVLYGVRVLGQPLENVTTGIPNGPFDLAPFGNVENMTGAALQTASVAANVTGFQRPEDAAWDPNQPNDLYFVTTAAFSAPSRLWRLRFTDIQNPTLGGRLELLLDGSEGQHMLDNITVDQNGHVYLQEDVGGNDHIGKVWRYDIATDTQVVVAQHNPAFFTTGSPTFLTNDEEASGIIDMSDILGPGWFLQDVQAHYGISGELVQGGQLLALFDPASVP
jgi:hypothetical protein